MMRAAENHNEPHTVGMRVIPVSAAWIKRQDGYRLSDIE